MKYPMKWTVVFLSTAILLGTLSACGAGNGAEEAGGQIQTSTISSDIVESIPPAVLELADATVITLTGSGASVEGKGAEVNESVITITAAGTYVVSGSLENGRIIVNAPNEDVTLALNGADITCSYGSPLYIYKAGTATVHLVEGTENALTDGAGYTFEDDCSSAAEKEPNACLYSKADLIIEGTGRLTVTANFDNGIIGKDTLKIINSDISVTAVDNGINGKDSNTIENASVTVVCGGDAIRSTNDTDETLGWVMVSNSTLDLTAGGDGIQAETSLTMSNGSYTITSGGGSGVRPSYETSTKGLKAGTTLNLTGGTYILDCSDDAIHSNKDVTVSGGSYTISTGDDALHADESLAVSGGEIDILTSYEGLEGTAVSMSGGTIHVTSSDDGVNAAGGADGSGFGGFGHGNSFWGANSDSLIDISGGCLVVRAGGDGLDSNGNAVMSGGTVIVFSTGLGDGALDYDGSFTLSGGTLLAVGSGSMSQTPNEVSQYTISLGFDNSLPEGTYISLADENQSFVLELPITAYSIVYSSPDLKGGAAYTVSYGGSYSGESVDGICSGGAYSGGTDLTVLTLSNYITAYGIRSTGNMGGWPGRNMGDRPNGGMDNKPQGGRGGMPPDGDVPGGDGMPGDWQKRGEQDGLPPEGDAPGGDGMPGDWQKRGGQDGMPPEGDAPEGNGMPGDWQRHGGQDGVPPER